MEELEKKQWNEFLSKSPFVSRDISHGEFADGILNGNFDIDFTLKDIDVPALCTRKKKTSLGLIHIICFLAPFLFVIIFSVIYSSWWLLFGLLVAYVAIILTHSNGYNISIYLLILAIGWWIAGGFHFSDYFTFFSLTFILSQLLTSIEKEYDKIYLKDALVRDPELFYATVDKLTIHRKK